MKARSQGRIVTLLFDHSVLSDHHRGDEGDEEVFSVPSVPSVVKAAGTNHHRGTEKAELYSVISVSPW